MLRTAKMLSQNVRRTSAKTRDDTGQKRTGNYQPDKDSGPDAKGEYNHDHNKPDGGNDVGLKITQQVFDLLSLVWQVGNFDGFRLVGAQFSNQALHLGNGLNDVGTGSFGHL